MINYFIFSQFPGCIRWGCVTIIFKIKYSEIFHYNCHSPLSSSQVASLCWPPRLLPPLARLPLLLSSLSCWLPWAWWVWWALPGWLWWHCRSAGDPCCVSRPVVSAASSIWWQEPAQSPAELVDYFTFHFNLRTYKLSFKGRAKLQRICESIWFNIQKNVNEIKYHIQVNLLIKLV